MKVEYDKYYQTEDLFGKPYPELIAYYSSLKEKGKLLDLGYGQGRDSIPLARLGFDAIGIDYSKVGIDQLNKISEKENLNLIGITKDIYKYSNFDQFDHILLDSIFHFGKKNLKQETNLLNRIIKDVLPNTMINICIQKTGNKVQTLDSIVSNKIELEIISRTELSNQYHDKESNHTSVTTYEMVILEKLKT